MNIPVWIYSERIVGDPFWPHLVSEGSVHQTNVYCCCECEMFSQVQVWKLHLCDPDMHLSLPALTEMQDSAVISSSIMTNSHNTVWFRRVILTLIVNLSYWQNLWYYWKSDENGYGKNKNSIDFTVTFPSACECLWQKENKCAITYTVKIPVLNFPPPPLN
jgi:hypothetical protein